MPLRSGSDQATISKNIHELTVNGSRPRSHDQIVAIALSNADRHPHKAEGGGIGDAMAAGGIGSAPPMRTMAQMPHLRDITHGGGMIKSSIPGRTDRIPLAVPSESHIIPADALSAMGQGGSDGGANLLTKSLRMGPHGTPLPKAVRGRGPPHAPAALPNGFADGGASPQVSILAAGSEYVVPCEDWLAVDEQDGQQYWHRGVRSLGGGDVKRGHEYLDVMIRNAREFAQNFLDHAPEPKK